MMTNAALCAEWADYIEAPQAREAFQLLVGIAATSRQYQCSCQRKGPKGPVRDVRFRRNGETPYAFIINREWLLFYFRAPAVRSNSHSKTSLARDFGEEFKSDPNGGNEWTVKLHSIDDVQRLMKHVDLA